MTKILEDHPAPWKVIDGRSHDARGNVFECDESTHQLDFMVSCVNWFARVSENKDDVCTIMQDRDELRLLLAELRLLLAEAVVFGAMALLTVLWLIGLHYCGCGGLR